MWTLYDRESGALFYEGTTVRLYAPETGTWSSTWISTARPRARSFVGRREGEEIVLDELIETGASNERWIFSEITPDSFRWRSEELLNPPSGWVLTEEMRIRRTQ